MSNSNGVWRTIAVGAVGLVAAISLAWTASMSDDGKKRGTRITTSEENIRTIHYEAQVQRKLLEKIADAVGAEVGDVLPVRPLREVK